MTISALPPLDPFSSLLLAGVEKVLEKLVEAGFNKANETYSHFSQADRKKLIQAFNQAWVQASVGKYEESLKPLLNHRPFQDTIVTGLLDPIDGFDVEAARKVWKEKFPQYERDLKAFFRALERILLRDPHWQPLLEATRDGLEHNEIQPKAGQEISVGQLVSHVVLGNNTQVVATYGTLIEDNSGNSINNPSFNNSIIFQIVEKIYPIKKKHKKEGMTKLIQEYLEWVNEQYGYINFTGIKLQGEQVRILPLKAVYVPLSANIKGHGIEISMNEFFRSDILVPEKKEEESTDNDKLKKEKRR